MQRPPDLERVHDDVVISYDELLRALAALNAPELDADEPDVLH